MTTDYQIALLSYLVQSPTEGNAFIDDVSEDLFDLLEYKAALQVLKRYKKLYGILPGAISAGQFLEEQIAQTKGMTAEIARDLREVFEDMYIPLPDADKVKLRDTIILEVQQKNLDSVFMDFAAGKIATEQLFIKVNKIQALVRSDVDDHKDGGFLIEDRDRHWSEYVDGHPTFLHDLNAMTSANGFYSPQLIIFMSGPKHFKTGLLIKLALEYVRDGYKVYYADGENGAASIRNRFKMAAMECTRQELKEPEIQEELNDVLFRIGKFMGGDIYIDSYPAMSCSMKDVDGRLSALEHEYGWTPDIIVYDSIDHFIPSKAEDQRRDPRIRIQLVYHEAIALNKRRGTFALAPSQVNRAALKKKTFDITDLSEDFGKAMNAHCVMAICATDEEMELGIRRIIPVAQREGVSYKGKNMCLIQIDESRQMVSEIDKDYYLSNVSDE